jgi:hypothetical protein
MNLAKEYDRVQALSESELEVYCKAHRIDMSGEFNELSDARNFVCEQLGLAQHADGAGADLDRLTREHQRKHPDLSYSKCLSLMQQRHPDLAKRYAHRKDA